MKKRSVPGKPGKTPSAPSKQPTKPSKTATKPSDKPTDSNIDSSKPENDLDDLSTKPFEELSISEASCTQPSESSVTSGDKQIVLTWQSQFNIKYSGDVYTPTVEGCCFMPSGDLVICDNRNQLVKKFNKGLSNKGSLFLPVGPFDIAVLDKTSVIVTLPDQKKLQLIQVLPSLQKGSTIAVEKECWGIDVVSKKIFVSCYTAGIEDGEVRIFGLFGNLIKSFFVCNIGSNRLKTVEHIGVSRSGDKVFVTDWETNTLLCVTTDAKLVYEYQDAELEKPSGLYIDESDNVFVCGYGSRNIQVIAAHGRKQKTLLSTMQYDPSSVAYRPSDRFLAIGCSKSDEMLYCNL